MTRKYAARTKVPVSQSKSEIEKLLRRYGARQFFSGWEEDGNLVGFSILDESGEARQVRLYLPHCEADGLTVNQRETEERRRWRALVLVIKAKLEAVESGISTIEREFLADVVLPNGKTFSAWAAPQLSAAYSSGKMPKLLPGGKK